MAGKRFSKMLMRRGGSYRSLVGKDSPSLKVVR
jgi:hypothetical protein